MRRALAAGAVLLLAAQGAAQELGARVAAAAGTEAIGVLQVPELGALLKKADRFGAPWAAQFSAMFPLFGPNVFRSVQTRQLDLAWPVTFVLVAQRGAPVRFAYTAGTRDPAAFLAGLGQPGAPAGGVTTYLAPSGRSFYAAARREEVLVSDSRELAAEALAAAPLPLLLEKVQGDAQLDLPVARLLVLYGEKIELAKADFFQRLEGLHRQPGISTKEMRTFYGLYFLLAEAFLRQVETLSLSLGLDGGDLVVRVRLRPVSGTALDRWLSAQTGLPETAVVHVPKDAALALALAARSTPELSEAMLTLLDPAGVLGSALPSLEPYSGDNSQPTPAVGAELRRKYREFYDALGPQYSLVVLQPLAGRPGLRSVATFDCSEPELFMPRLQGLLMKALPFLVKFYRELGWGFDMWLAASLPAEMPAGTQQLEMRFTGLSKEQRAIFDALYGGPNMRVYVRLAGTRGLVVTGPDSGALMKEWSGRLEALAKQPQPAAKPPAPGAGWRLAAGFVDLPRYLQMNLDALPEAQRELARPAVPLALGVPQQMFLSAHAAAGALRLELRYPLESTLRAYKSLKP